jgi:hypothetical protein
MLISPGAFFEVKKASELVFIRKLKLLQPVNTSE